MNACSPSRIGLLLLMLLLAGCEKDRLDEQVKVLCAKDGGVKVYETVQVAQDSIHRTWGSDSSIGLRKGEDALGPEYIFVSEITEYQVWEPEVSSVRLPNCAAS